MIERHKLVAYLNQLLDAASFSDYCANGLQIEGKGQISRIMTGVSACMKLLEQAQMWKADAILVHHGYFWKGEPPEITGTRYQRVAKIIKSDMNLLAYHLPIDCHLTLGNNAKLGEVLELEQVRAHAVDGVNNLLWSGELKGALSIADLSKLLALKIGQKPLHLPGRVSGSIKTLAWCSGAAHKYASHAKRLGADAFITGEVSEQTLHLADEENIHVFACGHHATERFGIRALGEHLQARFGVIHHFHDVPNPV